MTAGRTSVATDTPKPDRSMAEAKRILVADDSETITTLLATALRGLGYEVLTAADGSEAYELGRDGSFDLVIIDQLMPGLLGLEVVARWNDEGVQPDVIVLTGVDDERVVADSYELGAEHFVTKPFQLQDLLSKIEERLRI